MSGFRPHLAAAAAAASPKPLPSAPAEGDFRFQSLGTREIKGKGVMELFAVRPGTQRMLPVGPTLPASKNPHARRTGTSIKRRPTKYRRAAAELAQAAIGLAEDAGSSEPTRSRGSLPAAASRSPRVRYSLPPTSDAHRRVHMPEAPFVDSLGSQNAITTSLKPGMYQHLESPEFRIENYGNGQATGGHHAQSESLTAASIFPSPTQIESGNASSPNLYPPDPRYSIASSYTEKLSPPAEIRSSQRFSRLISEMTPVQPAASEALITAYRSQLHRKREEEATRSQEDNGSSSLFALLRGLLEEFLRMPASELSHSQQYEKFSSQVHKWKACFADRRIERLFLASTRNGPDAERDTVRVMIKGCIASTIAIAVAGIEVFNGGPASLDFLARPTPPTLPRRSSTGYLVSFLFLAAQILVCVATLIDIQYREWRVLAKKRQRRHAGLVGNRNVDLSNLSEEFARMQRDIAAVGRSASTTRRGPSSAASNEQVPLVLILPAGSARQERSPALEPARTGPLPAPPAEGVRRRRFKLLAYHVVTFAFFAVIDTILLATPIGRRYWFAPALLVTATFYSIFLDIGNPSLLHASLWTFLVTATSSFALQLANRMTIVETSAILGLGFAAFVLLRRTSHLAQRTGFLLKFVLNTQKKLSYMEARRSAQLLMSILPERILRRVIDDPRGMIVEEFAAVTFLHLDVCGFTNLSSNLSPDAVVVLLNVLFTQFDDVCRKYGVEKMTTIGDAYVAFGVSRAATMAAEAGEKPVDDNEEHLPVALATCKAAVELQRVVASFNASDFASVLLEPSGQSGVRVRVAVHTGRGHGCLLGGTTRLKYEFVGDGLRVAERVQERCPEGSAAVSEATVMRLGSAGRNLLRQSSGNVDDLTMWILPDTVEGLRCFVMRKESP